MLLTALSTRVDIQVALNTGSKPVFRTNGNSWEPYFASSDIKSGRPNKTDLILTSFGLTLDPRLAHVWADLQEFCSILNLAFISRRKIEPKLFQEITVSVQYRLLHLSYIDDLGLNQTQTLKDKLHEMVRVGLLAFTTTISLHATNDKVRFRHLASHLKEILQAMDKPLDSNGEEMKLWLLFVAALSVFRTGPRAWLKDDLIKSLEALQISSWMAAKKVLKGFLWVDMIHDVGGKRVFEWCTLPLPRADVL